MLTQKCVTELGRIFRFFFALTVTPYEWNNRFRRLDVTKTRWRLYIWKSHLVFWCINALYMSCTFITRSIADDFRNTTDLILHLVCAFAYDALVLSCINDMMFVSEIAECRKAETRDDFPAPVRPTIPIFSPGFILQLIPFRTRSNPSW